MSDIKVADGIYYLVVVLNIGQSIDLAQARKLLKIHSSIDSTMQFLPDSKCFGYKPQPLRFSAKYSGHPQQQLSATVQITAWDFGAASFCYQWQIPEETSISSLIEKGKELNFIFNKDARSRAHDLVGVLNPTIFKPDVSETFEDYPIFVINRFSETCDAARLRTGLAPTIAKLLWQDENATSQYVVNEVLEGSFSANNQELVVIDWEGALVFSPKHEDACTVLEFALVQSLEMRILIEQLNYQLDAAYLKFNKANALYKTELKQLAQLSVEGAWAYESVADPLNLVGERYLSHIYSIAAGQFKFSELDQDISRKLETLNDIYQKVQDRRTALSAHFLELVIIILIATEIILAIGR